ncbi:MAG: hypothetical protein HYZ63_00015 [Candidatus Andersenbacteria bacterium]|nr:hypothetical protein [Candidatus Andersenbacteria bacterium]
MSENLNSPPAVEQVGQGLSVKQQEIAEREKEIIQLYNEGLTYEAIGEKLGIECHKVAPRARILKKQGKLIPRKVTRKPRLSEAVKAELEEKIIELRQKRRTLKQMARKLKLPKGVVARIAAQLVREGRVKSGHIKTPIWHNRRSRRVRTVAAKLKARATLEEIGATLKVTTERARQLVDKITEYHGAELMESKERVWTAAEAAQELKIPLFIVDNLCRKGAIPCWRRNAEKKSGYLIGEPGMKKLRLHYRVTKQKVCEICKCKFEYRGKTFKTCSRLDCKEELERRSLTRRYKQNPSESNLKGWMLSVWQRLQQRTFLGDEQWIGLTQATEITALTAMQLINLRRRKVIKGKPHPKRQREGNPWILYALGEIQIVAEAVADYIREHGNLKQ